jgi:hypothetical protein
VYETWALAPKERKKLSVLQNKALRITSEFRERMESLRKPHNKGTS